MIWAATLLVLLPGVIALGFLLYGALVLRTRRLHPPLRDALILAAHSDDCVVVAGEYGIAARAEGRQVRVVYLTRELLPQVAETRRREAIDAWGSIGVDSNDLEFLDLPQADLTEGVSRIPPEQLQAAAERLREIVRDQPRDAAVFLPASGESHVDHRTLREISLEVLLESGRTDLKILQVAEYNHYSSLVRSPGLTLVQVLGTIPLIGKWALKGRHSSSKGSFRCAPAGFISGPAPLALAPDPDRMIQKIKMLETFASQDARLIVGFFGQPDRYQWLEHPDPARESPPRGYVQVGGQHLHFSVICLWLWIWGSLGMAAYGVACLLQGGIGWTSSPEWIGDSIALALGGGALLLGVKHGTARGRRGMYLAAAFGLAASLL